MVSRAFSLGESFKALKFKPFYIKANLKVDGGEKAITRAIIQVLEQYIGPKLILASRQLQTELRKLFIKKMKEQQPKGGGVTYYDSLKGQLNSFGKSLMGEFGLSDVSQVDNLLAVLAEMIVVESGNVLGGGAQVKAGLRIELRGGPYSSVPIYQVTEKGESLPWVKWLLEEGGRVIIRDYKIRYKAGSGRSGQAIMIKGSIDTQVRWSVPVTYQGTQSDNWVTQTLQSLEPAIDALTENILTKRLS